VSVWWLAWGSVVASWLVVLVEGYLAKVPKSGSPHDGLALGLAGFVSRRGHAGG
jgi:hypothetical protein